MHFWLMTSSARNDPLNLHRRSHCQRSRSYSGLRSPESPDTGSCPSPLEKCQSWWDHLREDGKESRVIVGEWFRHPHPWVYCTLFSFLIKSDSNKCSQCVLCSLTSFWPAEQTFTLWAESVTGGATLGSFTCLIQEGRWDHGCGSESCCDLWTGVACHVGVFLTLSGPLPCHRNPFRSSLNRRG